MLSRSRRSERRQARPLVFWKMVVFEGQVGNSFGEKQSIEMLSRSLRCSEEASVQARQLVFWKRWWYLKGSKLSRRKAGDRDALEVSTVLGSSSCFLEDGGI
jgi:hypothetical protein